jgi:hypothetical protein
MAEAASVSDIDPVIREVVGVRFSSDGPLIWCRVGELSGAVGEWVVAERDGVEVVGQLVAGRGQCLSFPRDPAALPRLVRAARAAEIPQPHRGAGQSLLETLP